VLECVTCCNSLAPRPQVGRRAPAPSPPLQAGVLYMQQHTDSLERMAMLLLYYAVAATALSLVVEIVLPHSFAASCWRVFSGWMQVGRAGVGGVCVCVC